MRNWTLSSSSIAANWTFLSPTPSFITDIYSLNGSHPASSSFRSIATVASQFPCVLKLNGPFMSSGTPITPVAVAEPLTELVLITRLAEIVPDEWAVTFIRYWISALFSVALKVCFPALVNTFTSVFVIQASSLLCNLTVPVQEADVMEKIYCLIKS